MEPAMKFHAAFLAESYEWYTPAKYIRAVHALMGAIDLDPASCARANTVVRAATYYDVGINGLDCSWFGRVFLNPPYGKTSGVSNQGIWSGLLIAKYRSGEVQEAVLLVNASTCTSWFQRLWEYPICFVDHKIAFYGPDQKSNSPVHGSAFVYFGGQEQRFVEVFRQFGPIVQRVSPVPAQLWR